MNENALLMISSNGHSIPQDFQNALTSFIEDRNGKVNVQFSIDGSDEVFKWVRGSNYGEVKWNIESFYVKNKQHHFLKNVMRIKIDDKINVFDGQSGEWISKVISVNRESTALRVTENIKKMLKQFAFIGACQGTCTALSYSLLLSYLWSCGNVSSGNVGHHP